MTGNEPQIPQAPAAPATSVPAPFPAPRQLLILLSVYFCLQIISRVAFSSSTDLDESEAVVLAQTFSLGYGSVPPLYTWLQILVFKVLGESVLSLSLLKNGLLLCTYLLTFATARLITRNAIAGVTAALSLFFLPTIAWESQRDLTHSVLSCTLSVGTLFSLIQVHRTRKLVWYAGLGLFAGLGLISKYNYALWLVGLLLSAATLAELRPALFDRRIFVSLCLMLLIFLPNGLWMWGHRDLALLTSSKLEFRQHLTRLEAAPIGLKNIVQSVLAFAGPITLLYVLLFSRAKRSVPAQPGSAYPKLMLRAWIVVLLILVLLVFIAKATGFKERWFQPILVTLPIFAVTLVQTRLTPGRVKWLAALAGLVMLAVLVIMPGRLFAAERLGREEPLERPYSLVAAQVRSIIPPGSMVVCDTRLLAGNLRLGLPGVTLFTPELSPLFPTGFQDCFVCWDATKTEDMPPALRAWVAKVSDQQSALQEPQFFQARYFYHQSKQFRLALLKVY